MKHAKKLAGVLLAMVMVLSLAAVAFAAGSNDGSITITNATVGKEYTAYKIFDLTYSGKNVAYTYTKADGTDAFFDALNGAESPFELIKVGSAYNVTLKEGKTAETITTFLNAQKTNFSTKQVGDTVTAESATVKFENLPYGYYYITSTLGGTVTIDSTTKDVEVVDKNQAPSWDNDNPDTPEPTKPGKVIIDANGNKVTENSVNFGETVNFSVAINATAYVGNKQVTYYYIKDTLAAGFSAAQNIEVYVGSDKLAADKYTLSQDGNTFQVTVPYAEDTYGANSVIQVKYSAIVLNTATRIPQTSPMIPRIPEPHPLPIPIPLLRTPLIMRKPLRPMSTHWVS